MKDEDIRNLLGGYATGTLTQIERELLYTAALKDQHLFDALADEESLRALLSDPLSRRQLLDALPPAPEKAGVWESVIGWMQRPAAWGAAATVVTGLILTVVLRREFPPVAQVAMKPELSVAELRSRMEVRSQPEPPLPKVMQPSKTSPRADTVQEIAKDARGGGQFQHVAPKPAASRMKIAVLDFNAPAALRLKPLLARQLPIFWERSSIRTAIPLPAEGKLTKRFRRKS